MTRYSSKYLNISSMWSDDNPDFIGMMFTVPGAIIVGRPVLDVDIDNEKSLHARILRAKNRTLDTHDLELINDGSFFPVKDCVVFQCNRVFHQTELMIHSGDISSFSLVDLNSFREQNAFPST